MKQTEIVVTAKVRPSIVFIVKLKFTKHKKCREGFLNGQKKINYDLRGTTKL